MSKPVKPEAGRSRHLFGIVAVELFFQVTVQVVQVVHRVRACPVDSEYREDRHPSEHGSEVACDTAHIPGNTSAP